MPQKHRPVTLRSHKESEESDEDDDANYPERLDLANVKALEERDGNQCLLCGTQDLIVTHRVVAEHAIGVDPTVWLGSLRLVPESYDSEALTNIMTPSLGLQMTNAGVMQESSKDPGWEEQVLFDLVIFRPQHMPKQDIPLTVGSPEVAIAAATFEQEDCPRRVLRAFRTLPLNPYVALAATFPIIGAAYVPLPDEAIRGVEGDCDAIRDAWNEGAPKFTEDMTFEIPDAPKWNPATKTLEAPAQHI
ncbi:hypothetical protein TRAPUB_897 [Trametes pubescens]|uniref:Uncharacterized protein n=1 Tax=Trametes pubescens TaxID=154538 RepID=A0A1M2VKU7_TRAPU|nr:hypothetical protein TRAPUB_897 [Trametes pubescens]